MPYSGFDPQQPGSLLDVSGGGRDPSAYYALSPGGRFPGDTYFYLEYLSALDRGTAGGDPDYNVPDWLQNLPGSGGNVLRRLLSAHERNVQNGGTGQSPDLPGGPPHSFFSGPGAYYGPPGGELNGVIDIGRPTPWDGVDDPGLGRGVSETGPGDGGGRGGGGGNRIPLAPPVPYAGLSFSPSFEAWNPSGSRGPITTPGRSSLFGAPAPTPRPGATPGRGTGTGTGAGAGGGAGGRGGGNGGGGGRNNQNPGTGAGTRPSSTPPPGLQDFLDSLGKPTDPVHYRQTGEDFRAGTLGGVDVGNLDRGTPGWLYDPTTGIVNTSGFPGPTPFGPSYGQGLTSYTNQLHDQGLSNESIATLLGPYGFTYTGPSASLRSDAQPGEGMFRTNPAEWNWNWGTGPVLVDKEQRAQGQGGYSFARDLSGRPAGGDEGLDLGRAVKDVAMAGRDPSFNDPSSFAWGALAY